MNKKHSLMLGLCGLALAMVACQSDGLSNSSEESASVVAEPKAHEMDTTGSSGTLIAWPADTTQDDSSNVGVVAAPAKPDEAYSSSNSEGHSSSSQGKSSSSVASSSSSFSQGKSSSSVAPSSSSSIDGSTVHCFLEVTSKCYSTTDAGFENMTKSFCTDLLEGAVVSSCDPYQ